MKASCISIILFFSFALAGQEFLLLQPDKNEGKDAFVDSLLPNANFGTSEDLMAVVWETSEGRSTVRSYFSFDLKQLPEGASIQTATLSLFGTYTSRFGGNSIDGLDNTSEIRRITSPWLENEVTWNTKPTSTNSNAVTLNKSIYIIQDYINLDVTGLVLDMMRLPKESFGLEFRLKQEDKLAKLVFGSSDRSESRTRPRLLITYNLPIKKDSCKQVEMYNIVAVNESDPQSNILDPQEISSWTIKAEDRPTTRRTFFKIDIDQLPDIIDNAYMHLRANGINTLNGHINFLHSNSGALYGISEPWDPSVTNWQNQPSHSQANKVNLSASVVPYENYNNIDITELIREMLDGKLYGLTMQLDNEMLSTALRFGSPMHNDFGQRPAVFVCYDPCQDTVGADFSKIKETFFSQNIRIPIEYTPSTISFEWSPKVGLSCYDCGFPEVFELKEKAYKLAITNALGCKKIYTIPMTFKKEPLILPTIISKEAADPINRSFYLTSKSSLEYSIMIYNRWGNLIFHQPNALPNEIDKGWIPAQDILPGVYVYKLKVVDGQQSVGTITVVD